MTPMEVALNIVSQRPLPLSVETTVSSEGALLYSSMPLFQYMVGLSRLVYAETDKGEVRYWLRGKNSLFGCPAFMFCSCRKSFNNSYAIDTWPHGTGADILAVLLSLMGNKYAIYTCVAQPVIRINGRLFEYTNSIPTGSNHSECTAPFRCWINVPLFDILESTFWCDTLEEGKKSCYDCSRFNYFTLMIVLMVRIM